MQAVVVTSNETEDNVDVDDTLADITHVMIVVCDSFMVMLDILNSHIIQISFS